MSSKLSDNARLMNLLVMFRDLIIFVLALLFASSCSDHRLGDIRQPERVEPDLDLFVVDRQVAIELVDRYLVGGGAGMSQIEFAGAAAVWGKEAATRRERDVVRDWEWRVERSADDGVRAGVNRPQPVVPSAREIGRVERFAIRSHPGSMSARYRNGGYRRERFPIQHRNDIAVLARYVEKIVALGDGKMRVFADRHAPDHLEGSRAVLHHVIGSPG